MLNLKDRGIKNIGEKKMILAFKQQFKDKVIAGTKIHSIREDKPNRWKAGNTIHFATGVRTKNYNQFFAGSCVSTQKIEIDFMYTYQRFPILVIDGIHFYNPLLNIDRGMLELAKNDGFDTIEEFFKYFSEDFTGKIIHWTNYQY